MAKNEFEYMPRSYQQDIDDYYERAGLPNEPGGNTSCYGHECDRPKYHPPEGKSGFCSTACYDSIDHLRMNGYNCYSCGESIICPSGSGGPPFCPGCDNYDLFRDAIAKI